MKILIAIVGSDYTRRMLDYLASHEWLRAGHALVVLTVVQPKSVMPRTLSWAQLTTE